MQTHQTTQVCQEAVSAAAPFRPGAKVSFGVRGQGISVLGRWGCTMSCAWGTGDLYTLHHYPCPSFHTCASRLNNLKTQASLLHIMCHPRNVLGAWSLVQPFLAQPGRVAGEAPECSFNNTLELPIAVRPVSFQPRAYNDPNRNWPSSHRSASYVPDGRIRVGERCRKREQTS